jgi:hypothetical protein
MERYMFFTPDHVPPGLPVIGVPTAGSRVWVELTPSEYAAALIAPELVRQLQACINEVLARRRWASAAVLRALVMRPPAAALPVPEVDWRSLPRAQADGAYGNGPTQARARRAGFQLQAPRRGKAQPRVGKIRNAVERCHNFFTQFGRVVRRFDRSARHYLAWSELAACIILLRSGFVS